MKKIIKKAAFFLLWIGSSSVFSQPIGLDTLYVGGDRDHCINILILSDGYTASEQSKFTTDAKQLADYLLVKSPWKEYQNYFNVYGLRVVSQQSGAKHPRTATDGDTNCQLLPISSPNNYFGSTFDNGGIHRAIYATKSSTIMSATAAWFPDYDVRLILVNTTEYGGTGGDYITMTANRSSVEVCAHELGHTFANLADEYWSYPSEKPNMTRTSSSYSVRWKNWLNTNGVGIYQYGTEGAAAQWFRPHQNCLMRYLNREYCSVCTQAIIEKIHSLVTPIVGYLPQSPVKLLNDSVLFSLSLLKPIPNTLKIIWTLDDAVISSNCSDTLTMSPHLEDGIYTLKATVEDTNTALRVDYHANIHRYTAAWTLLKNRELAVVEMQNQYAVHVYPNPANTLLNISIDLKKVDNLSLEILSTDGKIVQSIENERFTTSLHYKNTVDISSLPAGVYLLNIRIGKAKDVLKFVKF